MVLMFLMKKIVFIGLRGLKLQELYTLNNYKEEQLTNFNEWVVENKKTIYSRKK